MLLGEVELNIKKAMYKIGRIDVRLVVVLAVILFSVGCGAAPSSVGAQASGRGTRLEFVRVVDGATMGRVEVQEVATRVCAAYRALRVGGIECGRVRDAVVSGLGRYLVKDRLSYAYAVERALKGNYRPSVRTYVFVPMSADGFQWGYRIARNFAVGTASTVNLRGEPRYWHGVNTAVHEIGHMFGAGHEDGVVNVMHSNALAYVVSELLPFPWWMEHQIRFDMWVRRQRY